MLHLTYSFQYFTLNYAIFPRIGELEKVQSPGIHSTPTSNTLQQVPTFGHLDSHPFLPPFHLGKQRAGCFQTHSRHQVVPLQMQNSSASTNKGFSLIA